LRRATEARQSRHVVLLSVAAVGGVAVLPASRTPLGVASTIVSGLVYYGLAYAFYLSGLR
jgi:hypothetical protein